MLGVDVNLSLVSDGTSSIRNEARKPRYVPSRSHHGIDLKNPFTMSKKAGRLDPYRCLATAELLSSSRKTQCVVEPIGIEPMT